MQRLKTVHGGLDAGELRSLGLAPDQVLDFSANINPLGPSKGVREAVASADLASYPDRESLALREALAGRLGVALDNLLVGNGSTELIHLLARWRLQPGDPCLVFTPTFGEYEPQPLPPGPRFTASRPSRRSASAGQSKWRYERSTRCGLPSSSSVTPTTQPASTSIVRPWSD